MSSPVPAKGCRKVSVLYFAGCPNHRPTAERVRSIVAERGLDAEVEEVELTTPDDAERLRFLGSPTVQVDGVDIEAAARRRTDYAMSCRLYTTPDGLPSCELLVAALDAAYMAPGGQVGGRLGSGADVRCCEANETPRSQARPQEYRGRWGSLIAAGGSLVAAMLSSACCWVPLLLVAFGASAAGVAGGFGRWRPYFIVVAVTMLAVSFYLTFLRNPVAPCCSASGPSRRRRLGRTTWCVSALIVAAFVFFPQYVGLALADSSPYAAAGASKSNASREFNFRIEGMHCEACAATLRAELAKLEGVQEPQVDYATKTARIAAPDDSVVPRVIETTKRAGFSAVLRTGGP